MPFIPHTKDDIKAMLETIGVSSIANLFDEIPSNLLTNSLEGVPEGISEMELSKLIRERANQDANLLCFIGAGAYEHHIPAAVWEIATRGEFMTAYTPYQAEASQGSLQLIYEYQTMMASLMAMDVSNASLYDGASALAEAILMAVRLTKKPQATVLVPRTVNPYYRQTIKTIVSQQNINIVEVDYDKETGTVQVDVLSTFGSENPCALVIPQPNFFGCLEAVDGLTDWAASQQILSIGVVNPMAMALLKPPGKWGRNGVDIVCGEGQPLGIPMAGGGPFYGFLCCKRNHIRQMPGRIVGRTVDRDGKDGFVLTLQAREQHIRRGKATSNICTNQGLMVTASTIYMAIMGPYGLQRVAGSSHVKARRLQSVLSDIPGVKQVFITPFFNEIVLRLPKPVAVVLDELANANIQGGYSLEQTYPELKDCLLIAVTETKTEQEIAFYAQELRTILESKKSHVSVNF